MAEQLSSWWEGQRLSANVAQAPLVCAALAVVAVPLAMDPVNLSLRVFVIPKLTLLNLLVSLGLSGFLLSGESLARALARSQFPNRLVWFVGLWVAWLCLTMLLGVYPARSWIGSYEWLLGVSTQISLIGLALLAFLCTTNFASGHWLVRIFIWGSLPVLLYGVAQYFGLDPIPWARWGDGGAVMATLGNQNYFGGYLALLLPLTLSEWFVSENRLGRAALMVLVIGQAFCLIATGSKGAMLATVIACLLLLWWPRRFVWWQTAAALAAVVAVSMIATMLIALQGDALGDVAVGATRREVRPFTWESAYRAVAARPLFGWGSSSFDLTLAENASAGFRKRIMPLDRVMDRAHNLWLELAVESGLPGLGLWLAMTAAAGHAVLTSAERQSDLKTKTLLLGGVASLFGYMIYQVVNPSDLGTVSVFWWLVGWTLGSSFAVRVEDDAPPLKLENVKFVLQMLWLVAVFGFGYGAWQWVVN